MTVSLVTMSVVAASSGATVTDDPQAVANKAQIRDARVGITRAE